MVFQNISGRGRSWSLLFSVLEGVILNFITTCASKKKTGPESYGKALRESRPGTSQALELIL